ncbi:hypothetical protein C5688_21020 [Methylocystis sp. MitZ-2018]|nr:hypothetical protein C5688_21020 [Methylocystis sp. MitZ-2018]
MRLFWDLVKRLDRGRIAPPPPARSSTDDPDSRPAIATNPPPPLFVARDMQPTIARTKRVDRSNTIDNAISRPG